MRIMNGVSCGARCIRYPVKDGLVLSVLKDHTPREAESILAEWIPDEAQARATLKRVRGLIDGTA